MIQVKQLLLNLYGVFDINLIDNNFCVKVQNFLDATVCDYEYIFDKKL